MPTASGNLLKPGDSLGPYRIDSLLGKGGMGEVYRGTDTRLGRSVAIKVSAREFSDRFESEAKAISALNHPNVCTLYDVGPNYLVMEFVEDDTLAHLIEQGVGSFAVSYHGLFSVSNTGTLVYRQGAGTRNTLTFFDQQGNPTSKVGDPDEYSAPAISPDGGRVAVGLGPQGSRNIWILDVARGTSTRFTFDSASDTYPVWTPDGKSIVFSSNRGGSEDLYIKPADGSGEEKLLLKTDVPAVAERFTKDGRFLFFYKISKDAEDMWALPFPVQGEPKPVAILKTPFREALQSPSPDGRWLAYSSNESGPFEVYVRPFTPEAPAGTGAKWLVSKGGGLLARWRPDGKELFYSNLNGQVMAVDIDTSKGFSAGTARRIFAVPGGPSNLAWDLSPDGKKFLFVTPPNAGSAIPFTVVLNWAVGLRN